MTLMLEVRCPRCAAPPGEQCVSVIDGRPQIHEARVREAERQTREENAYRGRSGPVRSEGERSK